MRAGSRAADRSGHDCIAGDHLFLGQRIRCPWVESAHFCASLLKNFSLSRGFSWFSRTWSAEHNALTRAAARTSTVEALQPIPNSSGVNLPAVASRYMRRGPLRVEADHARRYPGADKLATECIINLIRTQSLAAAEIERLFRRHGLTGPATEPAIRAGGGPLRCCA